MTYGIWTARLLLGLLLLGSFPAGAAEFEVVPGVTVVGWDRLSPANQGALRTLLSRVPRGLYSGLTEIHIDGEGFDPQAMHQINCSIGASLYEACAHELGHQIDVASPPRRHEWARALIVEAGRESTHYLRSMFPSGFFTDYPQEFMASLIGEWLIDSQPMVTRAIEAWQNGTPHPLNQAILLMATVGLHHEGGDTLGASVLAYRGTVPELWWVTPWRCGGSLTISGPGFVVGVELDDMCRVTAVRERVGL